MLLNAKRRLLATRSLSLKEWKKMIACPTVKFVIGDGSWESYGNVGDVTALESSIIVGVYSHDNSVCWLYDEDGEFQEFGTAAPARASLEDPTSSGVAFETLMDGAQDMGTPLVQQLTNDDGGIEPPDEQHLLNDDLPI